ncbi:MAG: PKD domain-containing protein, partial [Bacteroidota bacterium]
GGAGGSIFLQAENVQGDLLAEAKGGNGGDVVNEPSRCFGPGGGGSGGMLIANGNNFDSTNLSGGVAGINTIVSGQCDGESNGALAGADGILETAQQVPQNQIVYTPTSILAQPQSTFGCLGQQAVFEFLVQGIFLSFHWQTNTGNGWADLTPNAGMVGIFEQKLTITNPGASLDGHQFRCKVTSPCEADFFSEMVTLQVISPPQPGFNFTSDGNGIAQFSNTSLDAQTYLWDFGDGTTDSEENPAHTFPSFGAFTVTLTATNDCGSVTFSQIITVETLPQAGFGANIQAGCAPLTVNFQNQSSDNSTSFQWHFPGGSPAISTAENPQVVFNQQGSFAATLIVKNYKT